LARASIAVEWTAFASKGELLEPRWTSDETERMNRTVKDATVKAFHYATLESLTAHVLAFVTSYN